MIFRGSDGQSFELRVLGYQFPDETREYWDANWLHVAVSVEHPMGGWSTTGAPLLTSEVACLADWLDALAQGEPVDAQREFTEPNIAFRLAQGRSGRALRIYFELESRPAWAPADCAGALDLWIEFPLSELDLTAAAASLRGQLDRYPERGSR